jgi:predicted dehydrogenase
MPPLKYGQIGTSHPHAAKLGVYRSSPDYEIVGIVEPDDELRRRAQQSDVYRDLPWMTAEQLLNVPDLAVVGVETRVRDLLDTAEQCIAAGKHVHIDKPAGESLPQFRRLLDEAARKHLAVQLGYMYRYSPAVVLLRDFLRQGWLGEPFEVHAVMSKYSDVAARRGMAEYRGGTMFDLGSHLIDLIVGLLGPPERVHAFPRHSSALGDGLADNMLAVLEYPRATATVRSSVNEVEGFARRHLVVCGSEGTFHIQPLDNPQARVALGAARDKYVRGYQDVTFPPYTRYVDDAADLARIVRGEKDADFSYEHDYRVQRTVLQACGMETVEALPEAREGEAPAEPRHSK